MNKASSGFYFIRKSPLLRALCLLLCVAAFAVVSIILGAHSKQPPEIYSVTPPVGMPGDVVTISGANFGSGRDSSSVNFGGCSLTSSAYLSWSDTEIKAVLPANVQEGLVVISTKHGKSKPAFFANASTAPVAAPKNPVSILPAVTRISPDRPAPGTLITISGKNFGNSREKSAVFFSVSREQSGSEEAGLKQEAAGDLNFIPANEDDFDYVSWSDTEISLYVPDGAASGPMYVETPRGSSAKQKITVSKNAGIKNYLSPKTYVVQIAADVEDSSADKDSTIILRCPRPAVSSAQPSVRLIECSPEPIISDFQHTVIHQIIGGKNSGGGAKKRFIQNFAVTVYEPRTS
ncbi:MAG: IPT/TIG domain-containing protein, partial [Treponemataceae bacterium]|nr:IPT/TIG domain-containing protein [Treponemataceae bacterium]